MNNKSVSKHYTIGELARLAGVTVRTLQYYDKENLLKSTMNESGRRIYHQEDIIKLQQILFLKSCGFTLEEIKNQILKKNNSKNMEEIFKQQKTIAKERIENLNKMIHLLDSVIEEINVGEDVNIDKIITMMSLMQQGNPYAFVIRFFNKEQLSGIVEHLVTSPDHDNSVNEIFEQMNHLYHEGADPAGIKGQKLAERWWKMVYNFTNGDPEMLNVLLSSCRDLNKWPKETWIMRESIENFLERALDIYLKKNGIRITL